ncbi:MAG: cytochrome c3 family protein [Candidatus Koribacter versatilis]|uniref:Cytochrome c3 family protein n=1 Tax=Candidatus Korobacter versatilis TaxID=658062 RepID=A0A932A8U1_9BACT|nr:cytochrome c3 family protein [Candidatus Koribacter versatilis]
MRTTRNNLSPRVAGALRAAAFAVLLCAASAWAQEKPAAPPPAKKNSCVECHSVLDGPLQVTPEMAAQDIHASKGIDCAACHGGDPTADDDSAMSKAKGFKGKPKRSDIPQLCASCHSNGEYMRKYNPSLRTDQLAQYRTSVHGKKLKAGDDKVAVCSDCHTPHTILPANDPRSKVNALNVVSTCGSCHADAARMKPYGIPTDQVAGYNVSVHHEALTVRGDMSAPTCVTCHGNHGAAPPGLSSVENVCANCHVFQGQLFDGSPHKQPFAAAGLPGCVTCHSNHKIVRPSDAMLGSGPQSVCSNCHTGDDAGMKQAIAMKSGLERLHQKIDQADELLERAERSGMEVSQAKLVQAQARAALTKARVSVHSFGAAGMKADIESGLKLAEDDLHAGEQAMAERDYRRKGLGIAVVLILLTIAGLFLFIRQLERR